MIIEFAGKPVLTQEAEVKKEEVPAVPAEPVGKEHVNVPEEKKAVPAEEAKVQPAPSPESVQTDPQPTKEPEKPLHKDEEKKAEEPKPEAKKEPPAAKRETRKRQKEGLSPKAKSRIRKTLQGELSKRLLVLNIAFVCVLVFYVGNVALTYCIK